MIKKIKITDEKEKIKEVEVLDDHWKDLWEFTRVCIFKFMLTEGEKILLTFNAFDLEV